MSPAKKKQNRKVAKNAPSALISRERSSIKWSIRGALVASISFSSSSVFMLRSSCGPAAPGFRRGLARAIGSNRLREIGSGRRRAGEILRLDRRRRLGQRQGDLGRRRNRPRAQRGRIGGRARGGRSHGHGISDHLVHVVLDRIEHGIKARRRLV